MVNDMVRRMQSELKIFFISPKGILKLRLHIQVKRFCKDNEQKENSLDQPCIMYLLLFLQKVILEFRI